MTSPVNPRVDQPPSPPNNPFSWEDKEIAYSITQHARTAGWDLPSGTYARNHWAIENREHYVRDKAFGEDLQRVRAGNQPDACAAAANGQPLPTTQREDACDR